MNILKSHRHLVCRQIYTVVDNSQKERKIQITRAMQSSSKAPPTHSSAVISLISLDYHLGNLNSAEASITKRQQASSPSLAASPRMQALPATKDLCPLLLSVYEHLPMDHHQLVATTQASV